MLMKLINQLIDENCEEEEQQKETKDEELEAFWRRRRANRMWNGGRK